MNAIPSAPDRRAKAIAAATLALVVVLIVLLGLALPGLGIVLGAGFALTVYRGDRRLGVALVGLGVVVTVAAALLLFVARHSGGTDSNKSTPVIVHRP